MSRNPIYYWDRLHGPDPIETPAEHRGGEQLAVACTQTDLPDREQRELVARWCELLPTMESVTHLWLASRVPQRLFDAACRMPGLEGLWIKWSGVKSVESLRESRRLRAFHLGSSASLESIDVLGEMTSLRWLGLENVKRIRSLEPLSSLTGLEGLAVEGGLDSTQHVDTLEPVGRLASLKYLSIANLKSDDGTLAPLFSLTNLDRFDAARWWDADELAEVRRNNPGLGA